MTTTAHSCTDSHTRGDGKVKEFWTVGGLTVDDHWRYFETSIVNLTAAVDKAIANGTHAFWYGGDGVDSHKLDAAGDPMAAADKQSNGVTALTANGAVLSTFTGAGGVITVLGNHDLAMWGDLDDVTDQDNLADYWILHDAEITNAVTRANEFGVADGGKQAVSAPDTTGYVTAYTYDTQGVRYVVMLTTTGNIDVHADQLTWLADTALDTPLPVIVLAHCPIYAPNVAFTYGVIGNSSAVTDVLDAAGNVRAVFCGHYHRNSMGGFGVPQVQRLNDIQYYCLRGDVLGANDGRSSATATVADGAHHGITIHPDAVMGTTHPRSNVVITGNARGLSKSLDTYGV